MPSKMKNKICVAFLVFFVFIQVSNCQKSTEDISTDVTTKKPGFFSGFKNIFRGSSSSSSTTTTTTVKPNQFDTQKHVANQAPDTVPFGSGRITQRPPAFNLKPQAPLVPLGPRVDTPSSDLPNSPNAPPKWPQPQPIAPTKTTAWNNNFLDNEKAIKPSSTTSSTSTTTTTTTKSPTTATTAKSVQFVPVTFKSFIPSSPTPHSQSSTTQAPVNRVSTATVPTRVVTPHSPGVRKDFQPTQPSQTKTDATSKNGITDEEISTLTEKLYTKEISHISKIKINLQGRTRSIDTTDEAPQPLLELDTKTLQSPTIEKMEQLFNNYNPDTLVNEFISPMQRKEENEFVDAVMSTTVMRELMIFLQNKGFVTADPKTHRDLIKELWFTPYSRGRGKIGSSGFEHVFAHEVRDGTLIGLHNWLYYAQEEKSGRLDYKGYLKEANLGTKGKVAKIRFTENGLNKPVNTLFIGTSPELELALYTLCFKARPEQLCPVSLGNSRISIQTYAWRYRGKNLIGSAYPEI